MPPKNYTKFLRFENAKKLIQAEQIGSIAMYEKWYQHNKPNRLPRRPDIIYRGKGWRSWNDFLGNQNPFRHKGKKKQFVSYDECKRFARTREIKTAEEWRVFCSSGERPDNIPTKPDYVYSEWFSWKDFLGTDLERVVKEVLSVSPVLYVLKMSNTL